MYKNKIKEKTNYVVCVIIAFIVLLLRKKINSNSGSTETEILGKQADPVNTIGTVFNDKDVKIVGSSDGFLTGGLGPTNEDGLLFSDLGFVKPELLIKKHIIPFIPVDPIRDFVKPLTKQQVELFERKTDQLHYAKL
jgi:hypothetical protein